ncbi:beta-ketoacyl-[acyl-carrier-protein] synthase family protein [Castellaniella caeni]|uniref:beta-ketoacyl-[acyl-carrier-protein] synthase family protein n=1 Tax=Castellaniella caeni TaxID=266123 RepID=UPI00082A00A7|nr:beta-ketoacyl-[acyl-carrier-protein] synthase family protein [Castellaniella caeni]
MIYCAAAGLCSALGRDLRETATHLAAGRAPGMQLRDGWLQGGRRAMLGAVGGELPSTPVAWARHDSRNNRLLLLALEQVRAQVDADVLRFGPDRVAVVLGTSTSGLDESDRHYSRVQGAAGGEGPAAGPDGYHYEQQELGDPARFLASFLGLTGPAYTVSTACSSSARAIISGRRLIAAGLADAALVGGADTLSRMPINGFDSLELLSPERCQPFARDRRGINIGEGAALLLLTREPQPLALLGVGESSDAWHMSAPHPEGAGAVRAMRMALQDADVRAADVAYINLHGTATQANDQVEAQAVAQVFGEQVPCSSVKHLLGHTLGAAGACEATLCWLLLTQPLALPAQDFSHSPLDARLPPFGLLQAPGRLRRPLVMSNAFAFGGNNTSLILGAAA